MKNLIDNEDFVHRSIPYIIATIFIAAITSVILQVAFFGYICYYIISNSTYIIDSIGSVINNVYNTSNVCVNEYYLYKCSSVYYSGN